MAWAGDGIEPESIKRDDGSVVSSVVRAARSMRVASNGAGCSYRSPRLANLRFADAAPLPLPHMDLSRDELCMITLQAAVGTSSNGCTRGFSRARTCISKAASVGCLEVLLRLEMAGSTHPYRCCFFLGACPEWYRFQSWGTYLLYVCVCRYLCVCTYVCMYAYRQPLWDTWQPKFKF
jgi:hypothetical protein